MINLQCEVKGYVEQYTKQENHISSLQAKIQYKECLVEDAERDRDVLKRELQDLKVKVEDLKKSNEILQMIESNEKECDKKLKDGLSAKDRSTTRVA